jgi:hypothetical protein
LFSVWGKENELKRQKDRDTWILSFKQTEIQTEAGSNGEERSRMGFVVTLLAITQVAGTCLRLSKPINVRS